MTELRERIIEAAYPLITHGGLLRTSLAEIRDGARVSESEFEAEFGSIEQLAAACLARREQDWTFGLVAEGTRARAATPEGRLLAMFDVFDDWFRSEDYEACTFTTVLLEMGQDHPLGHASVVYLANVRALVASLAEEAGLTAPEEFARAWHILMKGAIISAAEGDQDAALIARRMAVRLLHAHRPAPEEQRILEDLELEMFAVGRGERRFSAESSMLDPLDWFDLGLGNESGLWA